MNLGRGDSVDESALIKYLKSSHLFAAALDVIFQKKMILFIQNEK